MVCCVHVFSSILSSISYAVIRNKTGPILFVTCMELYWLFLTYMCTLSSGKSQRICMHEDRQWSLKTE